MPESDDDFRVREADLDRHLANPADAESAPVEKLIEKVKPSPEQPSREIKPTVLQPGEVVSKNDYQVNQALNLLKGLQILQAR